MASEKKQMLYMPLPKEEWIDPDNEMGSVVLSVPSKGLIINLHKMPKFQVRAIAEALDLEFKVLTNGGREWVTG